MKPDIPLEHVRRPQPPWRSDANLTECGLPADSYSTITRAELWAKAREWGRQRTYLMCCVTCLDTAQRWPTWDENPVRSLGREMRDEDGLIRYELLAIAALIDSHPDEFAALVTGIGSTVNLSDARMAKRMRRV